MPYESQQQQHITNIPIYQQYSSQIQQSSSPPQYLANSPKNQFILNSRKTNSSSPPPPPSSSATQFNVYGQNESSTQYLTGYGNQNVYGNNMYCRTQPQLLQQGSIERRDSNGSSSGGGVGGPGNNSDHFVKKLNGSNNDDQGNSFFFYNNNENIIVLHLMDSEMWCVCVNRCINIYVVLPVLISVNFF